MSGASEEGANLRCLGLGGWAGGKYKDEEVWDEKRCIQIEVHPGSNSQQTPGVGVHGGKGSSRLMTWNWAMSLVDGG